MIGRSKGNVTKGTALYKGSFDCTSGTCTGTDTSLAGEITPVTDTCYLCTDGDCKTNESTNP